MRNFNSMRLFFVLLILSTLTSCHVGRFFSWNFADVKDYKRFQSQPVLNADEVFTFKNGNKNNIKLPDSIENGKKLYTFSEGLEKTKTLAFLVIRNDSILFEEYYRGNDESLIVPSFSMAKSFTSALMGIAINEGYIKDVTDPVTKYVSDLRDPDLENVKLEHLLNMRSGIRSREFYYSPFADVAKYYYGRNIPKYIKKTKVEMEPDERFHYNSLNTQLLGMSIASATGKPLSNYLQEKIWRPLGMEYPASWSIDSKNSATEKAFCCINARARDFAKFGRLFLNKGRWEGEQIIPLEWVKRSTQVYNDKNYMIYGYQWWKTNDIVEVAEDFERPETPHILLKRDGKKYLATPSGDFYARGYAGQYIYVYPQKNIIIVRLGAKRGDIIWQNLCKEIARLN